VDPFTGIPTLDHEVLDDSMKRRPLVSKSFLSSTESSEILGALRSVLSIKSKYYPTQILIVSFDIEEHVCGNLVHIMLDNITCSGSDSTSWLPSLGLHQHS